MLGVSRNSGVSRNRLDLTPKNDSTPTRLENLCTFSPNKNFLKNSFFCTVISTQKTPFLLILKKCSKVNSNDGTSSKIAQPIKTTRENDSTQKIDSVRDSKNRLDSTQTTRLPTLLTDHERQSKTNSIVYLKNF